MIFRTYSKKRRSGSISPGGNCCCVNERTQNKITVISLSAAWMWHEIWNGFVSGCSQEWTTPLFIFAFPDWVPKCIIRSWQVSNFCMALELDECPFCSFGVRETLFLTVSLDITPLIWFIYLFFLSDIHQYFTGVLFLHEQFSSVFECGGQLIAPNQVLLISP